MIAFLFLLFSVSLPFAPVISIPTNGPFIDGTSRNYHGIFSPSVSPLHRPRPPSVGILRSNTRIAVFPQKNSDPKEKRHSQPWNPFSKFVEFGRKRNRTVGRVTGVVNNKRQSTSSFKSRYNKDLPNEIDDWYRYQENIDEWHNGKVEDGSERDHRNENAASFVGRTDSENGVDAIGIRDEVNNDSGKRDENAASFGGSTDNEIIGVNENGNAKSTGGFFGGLAESFLGYHGGETSGGFHWGHWGNHGGDSGGGGGWDYSDSGDSGGDSGGGDE